MRGTSSLLGVLLLVGAAPQEGKLGDHTRELLEKLAGDDARGAWAASQELARSGSHEILPAVLEIFKKSPTYSVARVLEVYATPDLTPQLLEVLKDHPEAVRSVASVLTKAGDLRAEPALIKLMATGDGKANTSVINTLGWLGGLLVEDDDSMAKSIEMMLRSDGYVVDVTGFGEDGLEIGKLYDYDIIILDLLLPDIHGYEVLRRLRGARVQTPILILSGLSELDDKVKALGFGADDYVTKPFHKRELIARIQAIVRRSKGHSDSIIKTGKLAVNLDTRTVDVGNQPLHLTGKEYGILELLSLRKGTTLTKEMFLNHLYGGMDEPELKIIDVFVCKLRKKLTTATGGENYIETVWGRGYVLRDPPGQTAAAPAGEPAKIQPVAAVS